MAEPLVGLESEVELLDFMNTQNKQIYKKDYSLSSPLYTTLNE